MPQSRYADYEESSGSYDDDTELKLTTYATLDVEFTRAFGAESDYGQSLGISVDDVVLIDGALYADPDKQKLKVFSWTECAELSPHERFDRGETPTAEDAPEFMRKTYAGTEKEYELIAARVPEDSEFDADSRQRDYEFTDDGVDFGEWEDLGGDEIEVDESFVMWFGGGEDPSVSARVLAETLMTSGSNAVDEDADIYNWLNDTSGEDVLREDLEGRRCTFFIVQRAGDQYSYNLPIVEDASTGAQIRPNNRESPSDSGNENPGESRAVQEAEQEDAGSVPEPVAEFEQTAKGLELTEDRANKILDDMLERDNALSPAMVDEIGRDNLIQRVV